jgi:hypothetical protein
MTHRRSTDYGHGCFPDCASHAEAIAGVHLALELIVERDLQDLDPDSPVSALFSSSRGQPPWGLIPVKDLFGRLLGVYEMASDTTTSTTRARDFAPIIVDMAPELVTEPKVSEFLLHALLGEATERCTWAADTVWSRSPRGIANERVRWKGSCTCATSSLGRPTQVLD